MKQISGPSKKAPAEAVLKDIRRVTKRQFSAEEKIRIVLEGRTRPAASQKTGHIYIWPGAGVRQVSRDAMGDSLLALTDSSPL